MCGDNSYSCPPSLPLVQPLADQQQAALRPATSIPYPIFASLLPSLSLRREVPMVGIWDVPPVLTVCKRKRPQKYMGLLRLSLVLPLGNSPFPWYVVPPDDGHCHFAAEEEDRRLLCRPTQFKVTPHWGHGKYGGYVEQPS